MIEKILSELGGIDNDSMACQSSYMEFILCKAEYIQAYDRMLIAYAEIYRHLHRLMDADVITEEEFLQCRDELLQGT